MTTDLEAGQIEALRRGLNAILQTNGLPPRVEKIIRKLLSVIEGETKIPNYVAAAIQKMIESRVQTPEEAAVKLTRKARTPRKKRPVLGSGYGRGTRPREKDEDDPSLHEAAKELGDRIRQAAQRRRQPGGRV